jgi:hypothetical protein
MQALCGTVWHRVALKGFKKIRNVNSVLRLTIQEEATAYGGLYRAKQNGFTL